MKTTKQENHKIKRGGLIPACLYRELGQLELREPLLPEQHELLLRGSTRPLEE